MIADTHIKRGSSRRLPSEAVAHLQRADRILHAGDVVIGEVLDQLAQYAPVDAVLGNNDHGLRDRLPETLNLDLAGLTVAMIHDSGPKRGRAARLRRRFPDAGLVVFGHSHDPVSEAGVNGQWLLNPGSPTERRRQPRHTVATFDVVAGALVDPTIHVVSPPRAR